jgi:hypothetical protein
MGQSTPTWLLNPVIHGLLGPEVLPQTAAPFEKVSAAIAVRYAVSRQGENRSLLFLVPDATQTTAHHITAGLLIANYAHEHGYGRLPPDEVHPLLKGNVLLVTPAVSECTAELEAVRFAGTTPLTELWDIVSLARHTASSTSRPRVFVANPGWAATRILNRRFSAVILDATHPRTLSHLGELMKLGRQVSALCIAVAPVIPTGILSTIASPGMLDVWLWDPTTRANASRATDEQKVTPRLLAPHTLWVCAEDPQADALLADSHQLLVSAMRSSTGRPYPGLSLAWSIVNWLRRLTMPLARLEQVAAKTWSGGLAHRVRLLGEVSGHGDAIWDSSWPALRNSVESVYAAFLTRMETAKFWALAIRLDKLIRGSTERYRIVAPSVSEAGLLSSSLQDVVDGLSDAMAEGRVEIVTSYEEARRVAEGDTAYTLLVGARLSRYRYLNVYPTQPIEELVYPFEASVEETALFQQYRAAAGLQDSRRLQLLESIGLASLSREAGTKPSDPRIEVKRADGKPVARVRESALSTELDLDEVALIESVTSAHEPVSVDRAPAGQLENSIEILFSSGGRERYGLDQSVDVYFPETDQIQRERIQNLVPGMRVICFVDGRYDSLFRRTTEAIEKRLSTRDRIALELWDSAKELLVRMYPNRRELYDRLCSAGLTSSYSTFCTWIRDEDETLAPQHFADFTVFAKETGAIRTEKLLAGTFRCIQQVRGRNRRIGRNLRSLLRALLSQTGYEDALNSIRQVDPDLADVYAAVDVLEVVQIRHLAKDL